MAQKIRNALTQNNFLTQKFLKNCNPKNKIDVA